MRSIFITIISFFVLLFGCSSEEKLMADYEIEVIQASYQHWSQAPLNQSDVRERGTDLELIVDEWSEGAEPNYIVYRKTKSFPAEITDSTETGMVIFARIIRMSSVMEETSERVEMSDRLVFTGADGETRFVEIEEWSRMEE